MALFTRMSRRPCSRRTLLEQRSDLLVVGVIDLHRDALAAATVDLRRGLADGAGQRMMTRTSPSAR